MFNHFVNLIKILMCYHFVNFIKILMFYHFVNFIKILMFNHFVNFIKILMCYHFVNLIKILMFNHFVNFIKILMCYHFVNLIKILLLLYNDFIVNIYIYNQIGNKFLQLTSPSPYKYINSINKTNQMTANVQAISIISKLSKIMSN